MSTPDAFDKPRHHLPTILSAIGALVGILAGGITLGKFVFTAPTREEWQRHEERIQANEKDNAVIRDHVEGIEKSLNGITVNISKLAERKR